MKTFSNEEIAKVFFEVAALYGMRNETFKARAYETVAQGVLSSTRPIIELYRKEGRSGLKRIAGVGEGLAGHLEQLLRTGRLRRYEQLKRQVPVEIAELVSVEGVGPKTVRTLWEELGVRNVADLERAARRHEIRKLYRFGKKSERNILEALSRRRRRDANGTSSRLRPVRMR
jgi:DNA polymerase (family 10)